MKMQKVTDSFELPKDIVLGLPIVTAYGYNELTIENHKGILSFSDKAVTVRAADSTIKISGSRLEIKEFTNDLIIIAGHLKGVYMSIKAYATVRLTGLIFLWTYIFKVPYFYMVCRAQIYEAPDIAAC